MLLAIDARNRSVSVGLREGDDWVLVRRLGASAERSSDEYAYLLKAIHGEAAALRGVPPSPGVLPADAGPATDIGSVWISSVAPALTPVLVRAVESAFGIEACCVGPGVRTGVKIRTDVPSEVGADLVCSAAAAHQLVAAACIVVDFGTAITFSAINAAGEFLGAAIAPGIATAAEALRSKAALIPEVRIESPKSAIGRTTAQSVQAGIILGYGGLVSRLIDLIGAELVGAELGGAGSGTGGRAEVIGTGDEIGRLVLSSCGYGRFESNLVLEGIALIASRAARAAVAS